MNKGMSCLALFLHTQVVEDNKAEDQIYAPYCQQSHWYFTGNAGLLKCENILKGQSHPRQSVSLEADIYYFALYLPTVSLKTFRRLSQH